MRNRMIWGLAILIILIIGVSVFLLTRTTETEPEKVYNPLTPSEKEQVDRNIQDAIDKEKKNLPQIAEGDRQQVEIEKPKTTEKPTPDVSNPNWQASSGRVGSDYPLLIETENPVIGKGVFLRTINGTGIDLDWESLSPDELTEKIKQIERDEVSLPDGYYYRSYSDGSLLLDERGFPILHKKNEPFITATWRMEFKPSPKQLVEYDQLIARRERIKIETPSSSEIDVVRSEIEKLKRENMGPVPMVLQMSLAAPPELFDQKMAHGDQLRRELQAKVLRQLNLEHLIGLY